MDLNDFLQCLKPETVKQVYHDAVQWENIDPNGEAAAEIVSEFIRTMPRDDQVRFGQYAPLYHPD